MYINWAAFLLRIRERGGYRVRDYTERLVEAKKFLQLITGGESIGSDRHCSPRKQAQPDNARNGNHRRQINDQVIVGPLFGRRR